MNPSIIQFIVAITVSFFITLYLIPFFSSFAFKFNIIDVPDGTIKQHEKATPYLGGVAVYCGFIVTLALVGPVKNNMFLFLVGSTLLLIVGLLDDLFVFKPYQKFLGQIIATLCFLKAGFYLKEQFFTIWWHLPLSALWILSIVNAFNLLDVMDGLAALVAIGALFSFIMMALYFSCYNILLLLAAFLGPLIAFFWYNKPSATIYLGDAGSLFIGGLLATIPFLFPWGLYNWYGYLAPIVILAIPLLELGSLVIIRTSKGIPFYRASPDHFCHYLQRKNWDKWHILGYIASLNLIQMAVVLLFVAHKIGLFVFLLCGSIYLIMWIFNLFYPKRYTKLP